MIGQAIGNYTIVEKLGEGGVGAVYKGRDWTLDRLVAVKALKSDYSRNPQFLERFRAEAVILARLNHPNIATLYALIQDHDDYFMVMEYIEGMDFEHIIRASGPLTLASAMSIWGQALEGVRHIHQNGVIHRDLKPSNLMLTATGRVKVMDFGIARAAGKARLTRQGHLVGTFAYMAPEQIKGEEADARSDIYSLGLVLYELLAGAPPFQSDSEYDLLRLQVEQRPEPLSSKVKGIPADIEKNIMICLEKNPADRFQSVEQMARAFGTFNRGIQMEAQAWQCFAPLLPKSPESCNDSSCNVPWPANSDPGLGRRKPFLADYLELMDFKHYAIFILATLLLAYAAVEQFLIDRAATVAPVAQSSPRAGDVDSLTTEPTKLKAESTGKPHDGAAKVLAPRVVPFQQIPSQLPTATADRVSPPPGKAAKVQKGSQSPLKKKTPPPVHQSKNPSWEFIYQD